MILPPTVKSVVIIAEPVTVKLPSIAVLVLISKPLFGEITACAEPDFNLSKSPIADALILNKPPPSPLKSDADIDDEILIEPLICVLPFICSGDVPITPITFA